MPQDLERTAFYLIGIFLPVQSMHLMCPSTGNHGNNFRIHVSSGLLMRGPRPLDRERNSSHVLMVEAYNHDLGPMRSSVRVRPGGGGENHH